MATPNIDLLLQPHEDERTLLLKLKDEISLEKSIQKLYDQKWNLLKNGVALHLAIPHIESEMQLFLTESYRTSHIYHFNSFCTLLQHITRQIMSLSLDENIDSTGTLGERIQLFLINILYFIFHLFNSHIVLTTLFSILRLIYKIDSKWYERNHAQVLYRKKLKQTSSPKSGTNSPIMQATNVPVAMVSDSTTGLNVLAAATNNSLPPLIPSTRRRSFQNDDGDESGVSESDMESGDDNDEFDNDNEIIPETTIPPLSPETQAKLLHLQQTQLQAMERYSIPSLVTSQDNNLPYPPPLSPQLTSNTTSESKDDNSTVDINIYCHERVPVFLLQHITWLIQNDGFRILFNLLPTSNNTANDTTTTDSKNTSSNQPSPTPPTRPSLWIWSNMIQFFEDFHRHFHPIISRSLILYLHRLGQFYFLRMSCTQLKVEDKFHLLHAINDLSHLMDQIVGRNNLLNHALCNEIELLEIEMALKLLNCPYLEKRISGLNCIRKYIDVSLRKIQFPNNIIYRPSFAGDEETFTLRSSISNFLHPTTFMKWLNEYGLISSLFGRHMHVELLRRCQEILKGMAKYNGLTNDDLDVIWVSAIGKHETILKQIYNLIASFLHYLPTEQQIHLFQYIISIQIPLFDFAHMNFLRQCILNNLHHTFICNHENPHVLCRFKPPTQNIDTNSDNTDIQTKQFSLSDENVPALGLSLLIKLFNSDDPSIATAIRENAYLNLTDFLERNVYLICPYRIEIMKILLKNVQSHWNVPMSLHLLMALINSYYSNNISNNTGTRTVIDDRRAVLDWCEQEYGIMKSFYDDLIYYPNHVSATNPSYLFPPSTQCNERLDFLMKLTVSHPDWKIKCEDIDIIWKQFIGPIDGTNITTQSSTDGVDSISDIFFRWLFNCRRHNVLSNEVSKYIFINLISTLNLHVLSYIGFLTVEELFNHLNQHLHKLQIVSIQNESTISRCDVELLGIEYLWTCALHNKSPEVATRASNLLQVYHTKIHPSISNRVTEINEIWCKTIMDNIVEATSILRNDMKLRNKQNSNMTDKNSNLLSEEQIHDYCISIDRGISMLSNFQLFHGTQSISHADRMIQQNANTNTVTTSTKPSTPSHDKSTIVVSSPSPKSNNGILSSEQTNAMSDFIESDDPNSISVRVHDITNPVDTYIQLSISPSTSILELKQIIANSLHSRQYVSFARSLILFYGSNYIDDSFNHDITADFLPENAVLYIGSEAKKKYQEWQASMDDLYNDYEEVVEIDPPPQKEKISASTSTSTSTPTRRITRSQAAAAAATLNKQKSPHTPQRQIETIKIDCDHPTTILSRTNYFQELFDLLSFPTIPTLYETIRSDIIQKCWMLLMKLPTNTIMAQRLKTFHYIQQNTSPIKPNSNNNTNGIEWNLLIDPHSIHKLHYALQIVYSLLPRTNDINNESDAVIWQYQLLNNGGLTHLINILVNHNFFDTNSTSTSSLDCLAILLKIILRLVSTVKQDSTIATKNEGSTTLPTNDELVNVGEKRKQTSPSLDSTKRLKLTSSSSSTSLDNVCTIEVISKLYSILLSASRLPTTQSYTPSPPKSTSDNDVIDTDAPIVGPTLPSSNDTSESPSSIEPPSIVIAESLTLLVCILTQSTRKSLTTTFYESQMLNNILYDIILMSRSYSARYLTSNAIYDISYYWYNIHSDHSFHRLLFQILCNHLFNSNSITLFSSSTQRYLSSSFMNLIYCLLKDLSSTQFYDTISLSNDAPLFKTSNNFQCRGLILLIKCITFLKSYPITETNSDTRSDESLIGIMKLTSQCIKANSKSIDSQFRNRMIQLLVKETQITKYIFYQYLFSYRQVNTPLDLVDTIEPPHCKLSSTRLVAFELLTDLSLLHPSILSCLLQYLSEQHKTVRENLSDIYSHHPVNMKKINSTYTGLHNLGATCYMNSLMQQLYMINEFRYGILCENSTDSLVSSDREDSMLYQFQCIFGYLQESSSRYYDARSFCAAYRDYEGQPMEHGVQMDVNEFFNVLFDKIETSLKGSPHEKLLDTIFGGTISNQLIGLDDTCGHRRERHENFFILSLDVKNKKNILESLDAFVSGETLEAENKLTCEPCGKKVNTLKRACIKTPPINLILHLKRFEFDLDTMRKIKINDYCEFPLNLDLTPYTEGYLDYKEQMENKEKKDTNEENAEELKIEEVPLNTYEYELVGVIVHTGTANSGHYYSFRKHNDSDIWLQFNDTHVDTFDVVHELKDQCIAAGTLVCRHDGTAVPIEQVTIDEHVFGWMDNNESQVQQVDEINITNAQCTNVINNGNRECITLTFVDGRTLTCTSDHRILLSNGSYVEAGKLIPGHSKVKFSINGTMNPCYDQTNYSDWKMDTAIGMLSVTDIQSSKQLYAIGQIIGALVTTSTTDSITVGSEYDANIVKQWIVDACGIDMSIFNNGDVYKIELPEVVRSTILQLNDISSCTNTLPVIISSVDCPSIFKLAVLRGLFGSDACTVTMNELDDYFVRVELIQPINETNKLHIQRYVNTLFRFLSEFQIQSTIIKHESQSILQIQQQCLGQFTKLIGFGACLHKQLQVELAASIYHVQHQWSKLGEIMKHTETIINNSTPSYMDLVHSMDADQLVNHPTKISTSASLPTFNLLLLKSEVSTIQTVYDLTVPLTSSFLVSGIIVHNCFGGNDIIKSYDSSARSNANTVIAKPNSAYMLFYQRKENKSNSSDIQMKEEPILDINKALTAGTLRQQIASLPPSKIPHSLPPSAAAALVPSSIFSDCWQSNTSLMSETQLFDGDYFTFVWSLCLNSYKYQINYEYEDMDTELTNYQILTVMIDFIFHTFIHAKSKTILPNWDTDLIKMFDKNIPACKWLLQLLISPEYETSFLSGLFKCTNLLFRKQVCNLCLHVLKQCIKMMGEIPELSLENIEIDSDDANGKNEINEKVPKFHRRTSPIARFIEYLKSLAPMIVLENIKTCNNYWTLLNDIASISDSLLDVIRQGEFIISILQFYLGNQCAIQPSDGNLPPMKIKRAKSTSRLKPMLSLLNTLIDEFDSLDELSQDEITCLANEHTIAALLETDTNSEAVGHILSFISTYSEEISTHILDRTYTLIDRSHVDDLNWYCQLFYRLMVGRNESSEDGEESANRMSVGFRKLWQLIRKNQQYEVETVATIRWIIKWCQHPNIVYSLIETARYWCPMLIAENKNFRIEMKHLVVTLSKPILGEMEIERQSDYIDDEDNFNSNENLDARTLPKDDNPNEPNDKRLFYHLLRYFSSATKELFPSSFKKEHGYNNNIFRCVEYFQLIYEFGSIYSNILLGQLSKFTELYDRINKLELDQDQHKYEIIRIINLIINQQPISIPLFVHHPIHNFAYANYILNTWVNINSTNESTNYNEKIMPLVCNIIFTCMKASPNFTATVLFDDSIFQFSIQHLFLFDGMKFIKSAKIIKQIVLYSIPLNAEFRLNQLQKWFVNAHVKEKNNNFLIRNHENAYTFLMCLLEQEDCQIALLECIGGFILLDCMSRASANNEATNIILHEHILNIWEKLMSWFTTNGDLKDQTNPSYPQAQKLYQNFHKANPAYKSILANYILSLTKIVPFSNEKSIMTSKQTLLERWYSIILQWCEMDSQFGMIFIVLLSTLRIELYSNEINKNNHKHNATINSIAYAYSQGHQHQQQPVILPTVDEPLKYIIYTNDQYYYFLHKLITILSQHNNEILVLQQFITLLSITLLEITSPECSAVTYRVCLSQTLIDIISSDSTRQLVTNSQFQCFTRTIFEHRIQYLIIDDILRSTLTQVFTSYIIPSMNCCEISNAMWEAIDTVTNNLDECKSDQESFNVTNSFSILFDALLLTGKVVAELHSEGEEKEEKKQQTTNTESNSTSTKDEVVDLTNSDMSTDQKTSSSTPDSDIDTEMDTTVAGPRPGLRFYPQEYERLTTTLHLIKQQVIGEPSVQKIDRLIDTLADIPVVKVKPTVWNH